jgi:hypothetical protein
VHQVGDQTRLYYDARSTNHKKTHVHDFDIMIVVTVSPVESVNELQIAFTKLTHSYVEIFFESLFAKLRKATNSFAMSFCQSFCPHENN